MTLPVLVFLPVVFLPVFHVLISLCVFSPGLFPHSSVHLYFLQFPFPAFMFVFLFVPGSPRSLDFSLLDFLAAFSDVVCPPVSVSSSSK